MADDSAPQTDAGIVIVGGGVTAARAAETLRDEGYDGPLTILTVEADRPYERPVLSKGYLLGDEDLDSAFVHPESWYAEHDVDVRTGVMVTGLDRAGRKVLVEDGDPVPYDKVLLATGSWPRRIDVPGADLDGVLYLRDRPEAEEIKKVLDAGGPLVVVGAGWIGLEIASAARAKKVDVTVLETADLPLQRVLGDEVAAGFADLHRKNGVDLRLGTGVQEILGEDGKVVGVVDSTGERVDAAAVVVGIGADPQVDWIESSGIDVDGGVLVDSGFRTSDPHVWAAGDIAAIDHPTLGRRVRVEHWATANDGAPYAARSMLGQDVSFDLLPFFYSDQHDAGLEYIGYVAPGEADRVVVRGDASGGAYQAFWLVDGVVRAAMHVNMWDDGIDPLKALVGKPADADALADPATPLPA